MRTWATLRIRLVALLASLIVGVMAAAPALASLTVCAPDVSAAGVFTTHEASASVEATAVVAADPAVVAFADQAERERSSNPAEEACKDDHCQHAAYDGPPAIGVSAPISSVRRVLLRPGRVMSDDRQFGLKRPPRA